MILDHQHDRTEIEAETVRRYPSVGARTAFRIDERAVEARLEPARMLLVQLEAMHEMVQRRQHDVRREGQGRNDRPWSHRSIVDAIRCSAAFVVVELAN